MKKSGRKPTISSAFDESELQLIAKANIKQSKPSLASLQWKEKFDHVRRATSVAYQAAGNFMKCIIVTPKTIHVGITKRNPRDKANPAIAKNIAFYRAITEPYVTL